NQYGAKIDGQNNTTFSGFMFANQVGFIRVEGFDFFGECDSNLSVPQGDAFDIYNGGHDLQIVGNNIHNIGNFASDTTDGLNGIFIGNNNSNTIPSGNNILIQGNLFHDIGRTGPGPLTRPTTRTTITEFTSTRALTSPSSTMFFTTISTAGISSSIPTPSQA